GTLRKTKPNCCNLDLEGDELINYTNAENAYFNPFWNPETNQLDFKYYINYWNFEIPDVVILKFGWNDLGAWATTEKILRVTNNAKTIIDQLHSDFPQTKVIFSIQGSGQVNNTRNIDTEGVLYSRLKFSKELSIIFEDEKLDYDFVYLAPTYAWVDTDNYTDGVHPNNLGFRQIADCLYPIFWHIFNQE
ncbi:SGNH/GDSL hydrolase family protein, partial [Polaribacter sp. M15]